MEHKEREKMKRSKKIISTFLLIAIFAMSSTIAEAGIIVGYTRDGSSNEKCEISKVEERTPFDRGIIVGLTGIIVGLTGIIVGYTSDDASCGHLPTGD